MHTAGSDKKHGSGASTGYPGQGAPYDSAPPPGQYYAQPYPPAQHPAQTYGYGSPPAQPPYNGPSYATPPQSYRPPEPGNPTYGLPPGPPPSQYYPPPSLQQSAPRDARYGAPTSGAPPAPAFDPPPLPYGWSAHWDAYRSRPYYVEISSGRTEWFIPSERGPNLVGQGTSGKDKDKEKPTGGHGTGALIAAGAAGLVGGALLGGVAEHEGRKWKKELHEESQDWKGDWNQDRREVAEAGHRFKERVEEGAETDFRKVAEAEGRFKAYKEEAYEETRDYDDDDDDDGDD